MAKLGGVLADQRRRGMNAPDRAIRWTTALAVVGVAVVAAVVSYEHQSTRARWGAGKRRVWLRWAPDLVEVTIHQYSTPGAPADRDEDRPDHHEGDHPSYGIRYARPHTIDDPMERRLPTVGHGHGRVWRPDPGLPRPEMGHIIRIYDGI